MPNRFYDINNNLINQPHDVENRAAWYVAGQKKENVFVDRFGKQLGVSINPKKNEIESAPDFVYQGHLADLKCQNSPFFTAGKYELPPQTTVTFNLKDALEYGRLKNNYEDFHVFFWVDWLMVKMVLENGREITVDPLCGVWKVPFSRIEALRGIAPIHWYKRRDTREIETNITKKNILSEFEPRLVDNEDVYSIRGTGRNAACSYLFDLNQFERII